MGREYLLDLSIWTALYQGKRDIGERMADISINDVFVPALVWSELYFHTRTLTQTSSTFRSQSQAFRAQLEYAERERPTFIVPFDKGTAIIKAHLKAHYLARPTAARGSGAVGEETPRSPDDLLWIAAAAIQKRLILATRRRFYNILPNYLSDLPHGFARELEVEIW